MIHSVPCAIAAAVALAGAAEACSMIIQTEAEWLAVNKDVVVGADCSFENAGMFDRIAYGPAHDLGGGRVYQSYQDGFGEALVADCNANLVTLLVGQTAPSQPSCPFTVRLPLFGPDGVMSLDEGADLYELEEIAVARGAWADDPRRVLALTYEGHPLPPGDYVNTMCGCRIFYPGSPGALH